MSRPNVRLEFLMSFHAEKPLTKEELDGLVTDLASQLAACVASRLDVTHVDVECQASTRKSREPEVRA